MTEREDRSRSVRFSDDEFAAIERAAARASKTAHAWMRDVVLTVAGRSKLAEQIGFLGARAEAPAAMTDAFAEVEKASTDAGERHNWLFVFAEPDGRASVTIGHLRKVYAASVHFEVWGSQREVMALPRSRIIAWEHVQQQADDPTERLLRWQLWGARVHAAMPLRRSKTGLLPAWS